MRGTVLHSIVHGENNIYFNEAVFFNDETKFAIGIQYDTLIHKRNTKSRTPHFIHKGASTGSFMFICSMMMWRSPFIFYVHLEQFGNPDPACIRTFLKGTLDNDMQFAGDNLDVY
jgi:hypothetical protein